MIQSPAHPGADQLDSLNPTLFWHQVRLTAQNMHLIFVVFVAQSIPKIAHQNVGVSLKGKAQCVYITILCRPPGITGKPWSSKLMF